MDYRDIFKNCKLTPELLMQATFDPNCSREQLKEMAKNYRSEKIKLECGKWFDKGNSLLIAENNTLLFGVLTTQLWKTEKGTLIFKGVASNQGDQRACLVKLADVYRVATENDIKSFEDLKNKDIREFYHDDEV